MEHIIVSAMEKALNWRGPGDVGTAFVRGTLDDPSLPRRILTPTRMLDILMRRSLTTPQLRCFQGGAELHPIGYLVDEVGRRGQSIRMADTTKLAKLLVDGCTLVLDEVDVFDPTLEVMCRALQWWSRELVQVNAYLTTQEAAGFDLHWDDHDVIIIQLSGEKSWEVRDLSRVAPMYRDNADTTEPSEEVLWTGTMWPGDIMHIPRGYWHRATRAEQGAGHSLHATIGFVKRTGVTWLDWLADQSRADDLFRQDLDRWASSETRQAQYAELAAAASRLAAAHGPAEYLRAREIERRAARHIPAADLFGELSRVVCISQFQPLIESHEDRVEVLTIGKKLIFKVRALPALELLLSGAPVDLTETDPDTRAVAGNLIEEGLCAKVTDELSLGFIGLVTAAKP